MPTTYLTRTERWRMNRIRKDEEYKWQAPFYAKVVRRFKKFILGGGVPDTWAAVHTHSERRQISIDRTTHEMLEFLAADTGKPMQVIFETACVHYREAAK